MHDDTFDYDPPKHNAFVSVECLPPPNPPLSRLACAILPQLCVTLTAAALPMKQRFWKDVRHSVDVSQLYRSGSRP